MPRLVSDVAQPCMCAELRKAQLVPTTMVLGVGFHRTVHATNLGMQVCPRYHVAHNALSVKYM